jgi:hypothetical protein
MVESNSKTKKHKKSHYELFTAFKNRTKATLKKLSQKRIVRVQLPFLLFGMFIAIGLSYISPLSSVIFFSFLSVLLIAIIISFSLNKGFEELRALFLGASITSVAFMINTFFFTLVLNGLVQIPVPDGIVTIFRSILLTGFFSLLERLTKFIEDLVGAKKKSASPSFQST